ncbi:LssY C-terminal domain-containing protein [Dietzia sp. NCCP-2495]|uniref:LssY C-terminal domain-containing protein n=1 Tax=Dietzia sp. NCCP-2495 TaxID=2934675 RepID=UPI00222ECFEA|nr:LssY C-terminal domain-containing protein [Dietzia sp. NCCP-2495]
MSSRERADGRAAPSTAGRAEPPTAAGSTAPHTAQPSTPPVYTRPPTKVRDDSVRHLPGTVLDTWFFLLATLAAVWLAVRLLGDAWHHTWWSLALLVPFWALVAYLVLPRLQTLVTAVYGPGYFIARTRTSDGLLGDPVNLAVDGTARQIHEAMTACGWELADDITLRSSWGIITSSVLRRSYPTAPVSSLNLFGRRQCLAYQKEAQGSAAQRHHVRFWRCPDGWLLPGGHRVQWLGAGTYDRAVGLSLFIGAGYGVMGVLAVLTYRGRVRARVWLLSVTAVSMISTEYGRVTLDAEQDTFLGGYPVLAVNVLILLLLTSMDTRTWMRRTEADRRALPGGDVAAGDRA